MQMPQRVWTSDSAGYDFGFGGQEIDKETKCLDYGFRIYNPLIAKFLSVDPLTKSFPWYTPYQYAGNTPIQAIDLDGLEEHKCFDHSKGNPLKKRTQNFFFNLGRAINKLAAKIVSIEVNSEQTAISNRQISFSQPQPNGVVNTNVNVGNSGNQITLAYNMQTAPDILTVTNNTTGNSVTTGSVSGTGSIQIPVNPGDNVSIDVRPDPRSSNSVYTVNGNITDVRLFQERVTKVFGITVKKRYSYLSASGSSNRINQRQTSNNPIQTDNRIRNTFLSRGNTIDQNSSRGKKEKKRGKS
jgi:RHS repeat-associated protein